jgi:nucleoside-diphosphate-sugar epimerase
MVNGGNEKSVEQGEICPVKILVTGAAGYIGSVLVPALLKHGHEVIAVDNFMYRQNSLMDCCHEEGLTVIRGDVRDKALISKCLRKADVIFPLACLTGAPLCDRDPTGARAINLGAIKMITELRSKEQLIVFPTTNSGYGVGQEGVYCTEETPLHPISLYGVLKAEAEKMLLEAGNCITVRLATAFGISPRMRLDLLVNDFTYRAVTDRFLVLFEAHFKRNYIHVRDVAKAFMHCLANFGSMKNEPYNVGLSDANLSKWELCAEIKKQVPDFYFVEAEVGEDPDKRNYIVSNDKIEATGYKPDFSLQRGISELIKGYQVIRRNQYANV